MASPPLNHLPTGGSIAEASLPPISPALESTARTGTNMFPLLLMDGADTLVYIDPPPEDRKKHPISTPTIPHRIHSQKLLETGSAYFQRLFRSQYQNRVRKQRGFADGLPSGFKYVLDLTPPMTDEDAIIFLTEVSCPMGIRTWAGFRYMWSLPDSCVGGEDDMDDVVIDVTENNPSSPDGPAASVDEAGSPVDEQSEQTWSSDEPYTIRQNLPKEYSASRHHQAIEQVLGALEGLAPVLDTPCKLWTFFAVAKLFDVASVTVVSDYIVSWFYESTNTQFMDIHPGITYRVACGIKVKGLCHYAFTRLVADEALLYVIRTTSPSSSLNPHKKSIQSGIGDILDDTELQRIEYASKSFADTMLGHFLHLAGREMPWMMQLGEYRKIARYNRDFPNDHHFAMELIVPLKDFVRYQIFRTLKDADEPCRVSDFISKEPPPSHGTWGNGHLVHRIMGRHFWNELVNIDLTIPKFIVTDCHPRSIADIGDGLLALQNHKNALIRNVSKSLLEERARVYNLALYRRFMPTEETESLNRRLARENPQLTLTLNFRDQTISSNSSAPADFSSSGPGAESVEESSDVLPMFPMELDPSTDPICQASQARTWEAHSQYCKARIDTNLLLTQISVFIHNYVRKVLSPPGLQALPLGGTEALTCLSEKEYRFLPLWADGNDDETGGVFSDQDIPIAWTGGFSTPGPAVHTGSQAFTEGSDTEMNQSEFMSTVPRASHQATYSHVSDVMSLDSNRDMQSAKSAQGETEPVPEYTLDDEVSASEDPLGDEFEIGGHSDSDDTVVMGESGFEDIKIPDEDVSDTIGVDDGNEFELVLRQK